MYKPYRLFALPLAFVAAMSLSGCKTDEEKAVEYFQSGQTLLAAGDEDRALVEFRNVFKYDPFHFQARKTYADVLVKRGELPEAYSQYLRLIEQYPDTADVRQILAEMAIQGNSWEEAERHGRAAITLAPSVPGVVAIKLALDYRAAVLDRDQTARARIAAEAGSLLKTLPDSAITRRIVIDQMVAGPDPTLALPVIDDALARDPGSLEYHMMKYLLLAQTDQPAATGAQLKLMFSRFPDNTEVRRSLIGWYMSQKDLAGAEAFLRTLAGDLTGPVSFHLAVVQFVQNTRGADAGRAELAALIAANGDSENGQMYSTLLASMDYDAGQKAQAIAVIQGIVATAKPSGQTRNIKGTLAKMLDSTGNRVGARALVEEILAEQRTNPAALKLRAGWAIAEDRIGPAVLDLNTALEKAPRDPEIFTLLALAQERDGSPERMEELLAKAVETSGAAPVESLRYARFQSTHANARLAESTLTNAWRIAPDNVDILRALADLYLSQGKWAQAQIAVDFLAKLELPPGQQSLAELQSAIFTGQGRTDEALALLQAQIDRGERPQAATMAAVQTHLRAGHPDLARAFLDKQLAKTPQDRDLRLLAAGLDAQNGKLDAAIATYRALIADDPTEEPPVRLVHGVLAASGQPAEASAVLDAGLAAQPATRSLRWLKAGELERDGKIEEAIALYEGLYAEDSSDIVVANNLASLIASFHSDAENLARAEAISRRLRGMDNPAFQDTYGWIAFLNGNLYGAVAHLEPAARGLPDDALTQFHLGMLYDAMGRAPEAIAQFDRVLTLAAASPNLAALPQMKQAASLRATLQAKLDAVAKAATSP